MIILCSGYLPVGEVVDLSLAYSTVHCAAVNVARSVDIKQGLVNIDAFIHEIHKEDM